MRDYIVLDIENPNVRGNSICAIAVITVQNNEIVDKKYTLINPEDRFDPINSRITGINSSMVQNAPTLPEYWEEIKNQFRNSIIVGHNVNYDLSVLCKSLNRYDIKEPDVNFHCTLELSQKYLNLNSHKLEDIAKVLNINYIPHNALEDAMTTQKLFEYLIHNFDISSIQSTKYSYHFTLLNNMDEKLSTNINDLYGKIKGINYDGIINQKEINTLREWIFDNIKYKQYALFNKIISNLSLMLEDNYISDYEKIELEHMTESIKTSKIYSDSTLGIQVLQGIIRGISCDEEIVNEEIENLKKWLERNTYLTGIYPYNKVLLIVNNVLEDGIITTEEKRILAHTFDELLNPVNFKEEIESFNFNGKTFCLTGEFKNGSKADIKKKIESMGAIGKNGVSSKLDYLFVGGMGSDAWKYGNMGGKILKAQELQENGSKINIISEDDLLKLLKESVTI